jgi:hypothetical protein
MAGIASPRVGSITTMGCLYQAIDAVAELMAEAAKWLIELNLVLADDLTH